MSVEAVTQPRVDMLVSAAGGSDTMLRRTEYRGSLWYGGRPHSGQPPTAMPGAKATIATPFWITDSLPYLTERTGSATVAASVSLQTGHEGSIVTEVAASLAQHPDAPQYSYVQLTIQANGRLPLGLSYQVVVLTHPEAISS